MKKIVICLLVLFACESHVCGSAGIVVSPWEKFQAKLPEKDREMALHLQRAQLQAAMQEWIDANGGAKKFIGPDATREDKAARRVKEAELRDGIQAAIIADFAKMKEDELARLAAELRRAAAPAAADEESEDE